MTGVRWHPDSADAIYLDASSGRVHVCTCACVHICVHRVYWQSTGNINIISVPHPAYLDVIGAFRRPGPWNYFLPSNCFFLSSFLFGTIETGVLHRAADERWVSGGLRFLLDF